MNWNARKFSSIWEFPEEIWNETSFSSSQSILICCDTISSLVSVSQFFCFLLSSDIFSAFWPQQKFVLSRFSLSQLSTWIRAFPSQLPSLLLIGWYLSLVSNVYFPVFQFLQSATVTTLEIFYQHEFLPFLTLTDFLLAKILACYYMISKTLPSRCLSSFLKTGFYGFCNAEKNLQWEAVLLFTFLFWFSECHSVSISCFSICHVLHFQTENVAEPTVFVQTIVHKVENS